MSKDYKLNLLQNAIDSLDESIRYYKESIEEEAKYKFCIILLSHFMELLLKHFVELQNPLLCYEKPYSDKIDKEKTITWNQAIHVLLNSGINISTDVRKHLANLADVRNGIIHYKFEYNTSEIRKLIVCIVSDLQKIYLGITGKNLYDDVKQTTKALMEEIKDEYSKELHLAQAEAREEADGKEVYNCEICGEENTVNLVDGEYHCCFCDEIDTTEECVRCGQEYRRSELIKFGKTEDGDLIFLCEYCEDAIERE